LTVPPLRFQDEEESTMIDRLSRPADHEAELADIPGPLTIVRGEPGAGVQYPGRLWQTRDNATTISVVPARAKEITPLRIER
jgi:hypothetical protein